MKGRCILLATGLLAGCTTVREMRDHAPRASYASARSAAALEHCLAGNLSWLGMPAIIHGERSNELAWGDPDKAALLITLTPSSGGTAVEVREVLTYGARVRHNVEACVSGIDE